MSNKQHTSRIITIDFLRGIVMIIMALDHTRDYFHQYSYYYDATDLSHTSPAIFFTRWITHFCAPVFVFLAGTSAYLSGQKKTKKEVSLFLLKRGLWLMLLELTIVCFGWFFNPTFSLQALQVIWVTGISMIVLSLLIYLPLKAIAAIGFLLIAGHNLLDTTHVPGNTVPAFLWSELHEFSVFHTNSLIILAAYPIIPWVGVMALGYCFGVYYVSGYKPADRKKFLLIAGCISVIIFIALRYSNVYGDPNKWSAQPSALYTIMSFLNTSKYPPSLLYLLMTIGPAMLFLAFTEQWNGRLVNIFATYGRVPLFYYLVHIYLLHLLALLAAQLTGFRWTDMIITKTWVTGQESLKGYGFGLPVVYLVWLLVVIGLYPLCKRYDEYKRMNRAKWWLSYL